jgi:Zn-finger nucleic acid-binding protein
MGSECRECHATVADDAPLCTYCGAALPRSDAGRLPLRRCPRGHGDTVLHPVGSTSARRCRSCGGLWVETQALAELMRERDKRVEVLTILVEQPLGRGGRIALCPACDTAMVQHTFAHGERAVIDQCPPHGMWFDQDELRRLVVILEAAARDGVKGRAIERTRDALEVLGIAVEVVGALGRF